MASQNKSVLVICLGNICRSPIAEAILQHMVKEKGESDKWEIDSAAIGAWHIGGGPDSRAMACIKSNNINYNHTVRQINKDDFKKFDVIFGMDHENMKDLNRMKPKDSTASLEMLGSYDPKKVLIIPDPYYGDDDDDFDKVFEQCKRCCQAYLDSAT